MIIHPELIKILGFIFYSYLFIIIYFNIKTFYKKASISLNNAFLP